MNAFRRSLTAHASVLAMTCFATIWATKVHAHSAADAATAPASGDRMAAREPDAATQSSETDPGAPAPGPTERDINVTGSRLGRSTFSKSARVTLVGEAQLGAKAASNVAELVRDIPALRSTRNNSNSTDIGLSGFNLRSLGSGRTLVLLDSRRVMDTSPTGGFDTNVIPPLLIKRIEIVTGGASSVYGLDAVTGVVNVFLETRLQGGKAEIQNNISQRGDRSNWSASAAYGFGFVNDRGHAVAAASYYAMPDILYQANRAWGRKGTTLIPNPTYTLTNGQFRQLIVPNARLSQMTDGGVITSAGPLRYIEFGENAAQSRFQPGTNVGVIFIEGGSGRLTQREFGAIDAESERINGFTRRTA